ncbi:hypothetical protein F5J12DRAFT_781074 [Pisolithus orientalis]|uniref:uncharacterized protein n=1 Tax=Pisolithus orientalis TaxID=936130 RepID=UPI0022259F98|nr:uncharacterized protein F5J12DRAFT_781074 [Pisolithus orientalis]KAI6014973.1 hypothetical protein F5J12DRAFT_781074 [Pisolithus orientalis]
MFFAPALHNIPVIMKQRWEGEFTIENRPGATERQGQRHPSYPGASHRRVLLLYRKRMQFRVTLSYPYLLTKEQYGLYYRAVALKCAQFRGSACSFCSVGRLEFRCAVGAGGLPAWCNAIDFKEKTLTCVRSVGRQISLEGEVIVKE